MREEAENSVPEGTLVCRPSCKRVAGTMTGVSVRRCGMGRLTAALVWGVGLIGTSCVVSRVLLEWGSCGCEYYSWGLCTSKLTFLIFPLQL